MTKPLPDGNGSQKNVSKYDSTGKIIEETAYDSDSNVINRYVYRYDAKGRMIEMADYDNDGKLANRRVYDFSDEERVPYAYTYYGRTGKIDEKVIYGDYEFNSQGDWVKRKTTSEEAYRKSVSLNFRTIEYYQEKR